MGQTLTRCATVSSHMTPSCKKIQLTCNPNQSGSYGCFICLDAKTIDYFDNFVDNDSIVIKKEDGKPLAPAESKELLALLRTGEYCLKVFKTIRARSATATATSPSKVFQEEVAQKKALVKMISAYEANIAEQYPSLPQTNIFDDYTTYGHFKRSTGFTFVFNANILWMDVGFKRIQTSVIECLLFKPCQTDLVDLLPVGKMSTSVSFAASMASMASKLKGRSGRSDQTDQQGTVVNAPQFMKDVSFMLHVMHSMRFAHMDLKPDNIVYCPNARVKYKLIDFAGMLNDDGTTGNKRFTNTAVYTLPSLLQRIGPSYLQFDRSNFSRSMLAIFDQLLPRSMANFHGTTEKPYYFIKSDDFALAAILLRFNFASAKDATINALLSVAPFDYARTITMQGGSRRRALKSK